MAKAQLTTLLQHIHQLASHGIQQETDHQLLDAFAGRRDEAAFAELIARHGPMVLRVCPRVLGHEQDTEDAFQATFLVLARHVGSIRKRETVANWLHGVAFRTTTKAKRTALRRRSHEARLRQQQSGPGNRLQAPALRDLTWIEVQAVLDEEIERLPHPYREAFVLCVLEGKSGPEAAAEMQCKEGTLSSRLGRARRMLQRRLVHRGIELAALLAALSVSESAGKAAIHATLARATIRFGLLAAAGEPAARALPAPIAALAAGVTKAMFMTKVKIVTMVLLAATLLIAGAAGLAREALSAGPLPAGSPRSKAGGPGPPAASSKEAAKSPDAADKDAIAYAGRVLDPDGKPVAGAKLYTKGGYKNGEESSWEEQSPVEITGPDGRFKFAVPKAKHADIPIVVTAMAANYGAGWVEVPADGQRNNLTLQLVKDDVPITGQVVDLEGKPVAGATVRLRQIHAAPGEDLDPWLAAVKGKKGRSLELEQRYLSRFTVAMAPTVTTDVAGRFRLTGIGRNRLVRARLDGPTLASQQLRILTRPGKAIEVPLIDAAPGSGTRAVATTYYPASFRHVAGPTRLVGGVIRDKDTGKPLPAMAVQSHQLANDPLGPSDLVRTMTDDRGRYRLVGLPKGKGNKILVIPADDHPYLEAAADVPDPPGFEPVSIDFGLKRGIWIEGRLTDKVTGRPAPGEVYYLALIGNQFVRDYTGYEPLHNRPTSNIQKDGAFRVVGLPGPGLLAVVRSGDHYLAARERDDEEGTRDVATNTTPLRVSTEGFTALARVDVPPKAEIVRRDAALDPGQTLTGTILGSDGKPLAGARTYRLAGLGWERSPLGTASFTVRAFNPRRPRLVLFLHPEKRLVGALEPPADKTAPVRVRMRAGAAVVGRLVDADGLPRANVELDVGIRDRSLDMWVSYFPDMVRTDRDGRFRIEALLPGQRYFLFDGRRGGESYFGAGLRAGETMNLSDVQLKRGAQ